MTPSPPLDGSPFEARADGVCVRLRVSPRAAADRVGGLRPEADGGTALEVRVTAPPEGGRANAAVVRLLAREWGVPRSALGVTAGAVVRRKIVTVAGDPSALLPRLAAWAEGRA